MSNLTSKLLETFKKNGVVVIRKFWSNDEIEEIKKNVELVKEDTLKNSDGRHYNLCENGEINSIHAPVYDTPFFKDLTQVSKVTETLNFLLEDKIEVRVSELFLKPAKHGMKVPPHQDNAYWCLVNGIGATMWTAVSPSNENNAGVYYYLGSNKLGLLEHTSSFCPGSSQTVKDKSVLDNYERVIYDLEPGDVLVHHTYTAHGSEPNTSENPRIGWTIQFRGMSDSYDGKMKEAYLKRLKDQLIKRGQEKDDGVLVPKGQTPDGYKDI